MRHALTRLALTVAIWGTVSAGAVAEPLQNASRFGVDMRAGPGPEFAMIHVLDPLEVAERGRCDVGGAWCLLSAGAKVGWVDTRGLVPPLVSRARPLTTATVESSTLDGTTTLRPLPGAITDAVNGAADVLRVEPFVARPPTIFATDAPFRNVTDGPVNLRAGPGTDSAILGELAPGQGGTIDVCDLAQRWCRMDVGGAAGWIKMTLVGLRRIAVPPLAPGDVALR